MNQEQVLGIVRHLLTAVGTVAMFKGWIDEQTYIIVSGAVLTAAAGIWSIVNKTTENIINTAKRLMNKEEEK